jgi:hypothetical protein
MNKMYKNTCYWLRAFSICLIFCNQLAAQERRTVLINTNSTETLDYKFENNLKIPIVVANKGANLHLWLATNKLDANQLQYFNLNKKNSDKSIGQGKIIKGTHSLKIPLNIIHEWNQKDTVLEFMELNGRFTTNYSDKKVIFNNSSTTSADYSLNKQPKLVVDYEVAKETYGTSWSQLNGNAQHSNRINWCGDSSFGFVYKVKEIYKDSKKSIKYISTYKNKPIIFGRDENNQPYIAMLTGESGNKALWRLSLNAFPDKDKQPVIMPDGKMLFVSEQKTLEILDLNEVKSIKSVPLSDIKISLTKNESDTINGVADEMTLGYDGTIYMPITNKAGPIGIVTLTAYPSLKPRWFYKTINTVGPVSLSENEKMAFFIETDNGSQKSRLMVLDNINGEVLARSKDILRSYSNDGNPYISPVTLQTFDKDTTAVYVLDGYKTSNKLYVFKAHYNQFFDQLGVQKEATELEHSQLIESKNSENVGLSKPTVFNNEQIFFMRDNAVNRHTIKSNTTEEIISFNQDVSNKGDAQIFCNIESDGFDVLVLYGNKSYSYSSILGGALKLIDTNSGNLVKAAMLPNLGICTLDNNETLKYFYAEPTQSSMTIKKIEHKYAYLKNKVQIEPTIVDKNIQSIIVAKEIRISSGFTVQKGAALTFQIRK